MKKVTVLLCVIVGAYYCCSCKKQPKRLSKAEMPTSTKKINSKVLTKLLQKTHTPSPKPELGSTVLVHYTAWLAQEDGSCGRQIDSSFERKKPLQFTLGLSNVIRGFEEGVMQMQVGEKRRLFIPSELGYGKHGIGLFIPPNSNLVFEVELLAMK